MTSGSAPAPSASAASAASSALSKAAASSLMAMLRFFLSCERLRRKNSSRSSCGVKSEV